MSDQTASARPAGVAAAAATAGALATLVVFVVALLAFLVAPLALFAVALVGYLVLRPRRDRTTTAPAGPVPGRAAGRAPRSPGHGFGSGVR